LIRNHNLKRDFETLVWNQAGGGRREAERGREAGERRERGGREAGERREIGGRREAGGGRREA
jgi:hypothetical protein